METRLKTKQTFISVDGKKNTHTTQSTRLDHGSNRICGSIIFPRSIGGNDDREDPMVTLDT